MDVFAFKYVRIIHKVGHLGGPQPGLVWGCGTLGRHPPTSSSPTAKGQASQAYRLSNLAIAIESEKQILSYSPESQLSKKAGTLEEF